jgi:hypothetical protein
LRPRELSGAAVAPERARKPIRLNAAGFTVSQRYRHVTTVFLDLIFRYHDGSFTFVSWIFAAAAPLMVAGGLGVWSLLNRMFGE